jgi:hypothetical protein
MWEQLEARKLKYKHSKNESYLKKKCSKLGSRRIYEKTMVKII